MFFPHPQPFSQGEKGVQFHSPTEQGAGVEGIRFRQAQPAQATARCRGSCRALARIETHAAGIPDGGHSG